MARSIDDSQTPDAAPLSLESLCGVLLPITTPFLGNGSLDLAGLRANIRKWNETGIAGYVLMGSTGERVHLDEREYEQVIATARAEVPAGFAFIAGAGQQSTRGTIAEVKRAAVAGADAVLVITPHFYRAAITHETLCQHFTEVADASPVPLFLYSMPDLTGVKIEAQTVALLSRHPNIIGLKDSSADIAGLQATLKLLGNAGAEPESGEDFAVLTGNGTVLCEALTAGAHGGILAVGCVAPSLCLQILQAVRDGDQARARELQLHLTPLARAVTKTYGIGGLKAALDMIGYSGGAVRAPLQAPSDEARNEIREYLKAAEALIETRSTLTERAGASPPS